MKKEEPKYKQLKKVLLTQINEGQRKPGDMLPSEFELADQFAFSRQTVRQAIGELVQEGKLRRVQGKGTFVTESKAVPTDFQTIGVVTTYISDYIFPLIVRGAEATLRANGYRLLLSSTDNDKEKERECLEMMVSHPLKGLIIEPTKSAGGNPNLAYYLDLDNRGIPYLMINERYSELQCPVIKVDDEEGGFLAADHLLKLGHRRIAGFFKTDDLQGLNRLKGFIRAHRENQAELASRFVVQYTTEEKGEKPFAQALAMLKEGDARPTAFVCYNDELAIRLLEATRQMNLCVPADLSFVGFDDSSLAMATEVKLTTLSHPKLSMGVMAAETLLAMIESGSYSGASTLVYKPELILRESTCPPPTLG
ncbi:GntR family transcriptional regulator [Gorillibacterium timonense]|uniref:GntR family transcriptional regulator n=1 Tax=Gorillibacterium timonense TaxID=1689269 RepID=UPI00071C88F3|nr:GntR family transcriptional regulator [Gorillibacterium timonense]